MTSGTINVFRNPTDQEPVPLDYKAKLERLVQCRFNVEKYHAKIRSSWLWFGLALFVISVVNALSRKSDATSILIAFAVALVVVGAVSLSSIMANNKVRKKNLAIVDAAIEEIRSKAQAAALSDSEA